MFDQILENFRKANESTMQFQQDMFKQWAQQWAKVPEIPGLGALSGTGWSDQVHAFQKQWVEGVTEMLNKQRETLDAQYQAGVRTIEAAFRTMEAKDPEQFRKLTEELWRQSFECLKTVVESQLRTFQAAAEKGFETMSKGATAAKP